MYKICCKHLKNRREFNKKEKCEHSQLRSMVWCGGKPFGHEPHYSAIFSMKSKDIKTYLDMMTTIYYEITWLA